MKHKGTLDLEHRSMKKGPEVSKQNEKHTVPDVPKSPSSEHPVEHKQKSKDQNSSSAQVPWKIYISRGLSAWGDRIWAFAVGIFMNKLAPESLRLVAIYGFVISISVIIFGAAIGNWIDRNKRLFAAKVFLAVQNLSVAIACVVVVGHFILWNEKVFSSNFMH